MKVLVLFGTRPEAIKLGPIIKLMEKDSDIDLKICISAQHREMLDQVLEIFDIRPDYDLNVMTANQSLSELTSIILEKFSKIIDIEEPDIVLVHGDTTTAFVGALACFYKGVKIGHVEAGLRTNNIYNPFPEEFNRQAIGLVADIHFSPTNHSRENLLSEGKKNESIFVTGNTAIDALKYTINPNFKSEILDWVGDDKFVVLTTHRRENIGNPMKDIFITMNKILEDFPKLKLVYPIHKNPKVRKLVEQYLNTDERVLICEPMDVFDFHNIISKSFVIFSDSGGIQEEAPSLGKPVILLRNTTERPEGVEAGTVLMAGTDSKKIYDIFSKLYNSEDYYKQVSTISNPYGDGNASERIICHMKEFIKNETSE